MLDYNNFCVRPDWLQGVIPSTDVRQVLEIFNDCCPAIDIKDFVFSPKPYLNYKVRWEYPSLDDSIFMIAFNPDSVGFSYALEPRTVEEVLNGGALVPSAGVSPLDYYFRATTLGNNPNIFICLSGSAISFLLSANCDIYKLFLEFAKLGFKPSRFDLALDFFGKSWVPMIDDAIRCFQNAFCFCENKPSFRTGICRKGKDGFLKCSMLTQYINTYPENFSSWSISFGSHNKGTSAMLRLYDKYYEQKYVKGNCVNVMDNYWYRFEFEFHRARALRIFDTLISSGFYGAALASFDFGFLPIERPKDMYSDKILSSWSSFLSDLSLAQNDYFVSFVRPDVEKVDHYPAHVRRNIKVVAAYLNMVADAVLSGNAPLLNNITSRLDEGFERIYDSSSIFAPSPELADFILKTYYFWREELNSNVKEVTSVG